MERLSQFVSVFARSSLANKRTNFVLFGTVLVGAAILSFEGANAASWSSVSCRTVLQGSQWGSRVPDGAVNYLSNLEFGTAIGSSSTINVSSFIFAECHRHPQETVGDATERLLHTPPSKLPRIPIGGA